MKIQNRDYVNERASSVLPKKILCIKEYKNPQTKLCFNKGSATLCVQPSLTRPPEATLWWKDAAVHSTPGGD